MGSGTAVAREASDLVLGDDSFATLVYGMGEGRRIVDNVQKGLVFLVSRSSGSSCSSTFRRRSPSNGNQPSRG